MEPVGCFRLSWMRAATDASIALRFVRGRTERHLQRMYGDFAEHAGAAAAYVWRRHHLADWAASTRRRRDARLLSLMSKAGIFTRTRHHAKSPFRGRARGDPAILPSALPLFAMELNDRKARLASWATDHPEVHRRVSGADLECPRQRPIQTDEMSSPRLRMTMNRSSDRPSQRGKPLARSPS